ncbi:MAG: hypothetical protein ACKO23_15895, partial [Gemmataceae bacterium]
GFRSHVPDHGGEMGSVNMTKWWKHVAVFAAWLGMGALLHAQPGMPSPVGAARIVEPLRYVPDQPIPDMVPGPLNPLIAPAGPPPSLNLPAEHTGAFQLDNFPPESAFFASLGGMGLTRQGLKNLSLVTLDQQNGGLDTGNEPIGIMPGLMSMNQVHPDMAGGFRATVGHLFNTEAFELTGFYLPSRTESSTIANRGQLTLPFNPRSTFPVGLEGDNNMWLQADLVRASYTGSVASAEANLRRWNGAVNGMEAIVGVRYFYNYERIDIYTDDDYFTRNVFNQPDSLRAANYSVSSRNNFVGAQFGGEYSTPLPHEKLGWIWLSGMAKGAVGPNVIQSTWRLTRADGYVGFNNSQTTVKLSALGEVAGFVDFHVLERLRLRAGYTFIMGLGFAPAENQIDFNLTTQGTHGISTGNIYWHGPIAELQFLF